MPYKLPEISLRWLHGRYLDRYYYCERARRTEAHTAVWTGSEMIIWGGSNQRLANYLNTGGKIQPRYRHLDSHGTTNAPIARGFTGQSGLAAK